MSIMQNNIDDEFNSVDWRMTLKLICGP